MHLRIARHTAQLDELVRFYRDGLGLDWPSCALMRW